MAEGGLESEALGVSGDGSTVVGSGSTDSGNEAFVWDAANGMRSLQDVLTNDHGLDLTGWQLSHATGISDDGLTIVGSGTNPQGETEAWIAAVPEPSSLVICLTAFGMVGASRRRRR